MKERPSGDKKLTYRFEQDPKEAAPLTAYTFDGGKLVSEGELKAGAIDLPGDTGRRGLRTFVSRTPEKAAGYQPTVESLRRLGAYELSANPGITEISKAIWYPYPFCFCQVRGRVVRPVTHPNGETVDYPVCNVTVHICEVDSIFDVIWRIPDLKIEHLRDRLIEVDLGRPFPPFPEPGPGPIPRPGPDPSPEFRFDTRIVDPTPLNIARISRHDSLEARYDSLDVALNVGEPQVRTQNLRKLAPTKGTANILPQELRAAVQASASTYALRNAFALHADLIQTIFCLPNSWYTCSGDRTVTTDENGEFSTYFFYNCNGDKPDLYFSVEYNGKFVHRPPIGCATRWNYKCGSEVTIRVTDPTVPWCDPGTQLEGDQLVVLTIGNGVNVAQIPTSGTNRGLAPGDRPFGGSLEPHVWFGTGLAAKNITHYRWSYRKGSSGSFTNLEKPVIRHYAVATPGDVTFIADPQGPDPALPGQLYKIQAQAPPAVAIPGATTSWAPQVDARENTASGFFLTHLLGNPLTAAGLYELRLELFRSDGTRVTNWAAEGIIGRIPDPSLNAPFGAQTVTTIVAPAPNLYLESGNIAGMRFDVHVDNNVCTAIIRDPVTTLTSNDTPCGFYEYLPGATVTLSYRASHPNNFASFDFDLTRGASQPVTIASAAGPVGTSPVGAYTLNAVTDDYENAFGTITLLHFNDPPCDKAAFALTLYVSAHATDGWSILTYLGATAVPRAIAFAPQ